MSSSAKYVGALMMVLYGNNLMANAQLLQENRLELKPMTCVVRQLGELCQMTVKVSWQTQRPVDACLYQDKTKLQCWQAKQNISQKLDVELQKSMTFRLIDGQNNLLAQQTVNVNAASSRQYRRRLKTDWSIF